VPINALLGDNKDLYMGGPHDDLLDAEIPLSENNIS
jgi:hypothetical protein